jgi:hypothetical protein
LLKFARRTTTNLVMAKMGTSDDKAKLLRSLAIDRSATDAPRVAHRSRWPVLIALGGGAAAILVIAAILTLQLLNDRSVDHAASQLPTPSSSQPPAVTAEPRRTGGLAASGYVVGRRKATGAAVLQRTTLRPTRRRRLAVYHGH